MSCSTYTLSSFELEKNKIMDLQCSVRSIGGGGGGQWRGYRGGDFRSTVISM